MNDATVTHQRLTVHEVAEYLRISDQAVRNMVHSAGLPHFRFGRRIIIPADQLELWLNRQMHNRIEGVEL